MVPQLLAQVDAALLDKVLLLATTSAIVLGLLEVLLNVDLNLVAAFVVDELFILIQVNLCVNDDLNIQTLHLPILDIHHYLSVLRPEQLYAVNEQMNVLYSWLPEQRTYQILHHRVLHVHY